MEDDWSPRPNQTLDVRKLTLTAEEGFVLSRLDGATSLDRLPILTGFPPNELKGILNKLLACGAVLPPAAAGPPGKPNAPSPQVAKQSAPIAKTAATKAAAPPESPSDTRESAGDTSDADTDPEGDAAATEPDGTAPETGDGAQDDDENEGEGEGEPTFRALFETRLHALPVEQRTARAQHAEEPELSAFCFDPVPAVIKAVMQNTRAGLPHARLVARHHRNPSGLEALADRSAYLADTGVRRWLTRNPQLPVSLARRLYSGRRLMEQYKTAHDRDVPELTRRTLRDLLRTRFSSAPAEKVELIVNTEGRALASLSGLPVDSKTTSLLCARPYPSTFFIQNVARWSAAPPPLIAHLLRQDAVRRQPSLRQMLKRHPNAPSGP